MNTGDAIVAPLHRLAASIRAAVITGASETFGDDWCESLSVPRGFFDGKVSHGHKICFSPERSQIINELVRVYLNLAEGTQETLMIRQLLRMELEPFVIGVGQVSVKDTTEGLVILRCDECHDFKVHDAASGATEEIASLFVSASSA
jgi:hypothetical protein